MLQLSKYKKWALFASFSYLLISYGCQKPTAQNTAEQSQPAATAADPFTAQVPTLPVQSIPGGVVAKVSSKSGGQISAANSTGSSPAFRRASVIVPPGALSVDTDIELSEASSFVSPGLAGALQVNDVQPGGPALVISADATLTGLLAISVPLAEDLRLLPSGKIVTVIGILPSSSGSQIRVFGQDELRITDGAIQVKIDRFGAYQAAVVDKPPQAVVMQTNIEIKKTGGTGTDSGPTVPNAFYISTLADLPTCDATRLGNLYYVLSDGLFRNCTSSGWTTVDLRGTKGDRGEAAPSVAATPATSSQFKSEVIQRYTVFLNNRSVNRSIVRYTDPNDSSRSWDCFEDSWQEPSKLLPANASSIYVFRSSGPQGCSQATDISLNCNSGYETDQGQCVKRCGVNNLSMCTTEALCTGRGLTWSEGSCLGQCGTSNLSACHTSQLCESQGMVWNGTSCALGCSSTTLSQCSSREMCEGKGFTWSGSSCLGACSTSNLAACIPQATCEAAGMSWKTSTSACLGICSSSNLTACNTSTKCEALGLSWKSDTQSCVGTCSSSNMIACTTSAKCEAAGMSWDTATQSCVGYCSSLNLLACNTLAKCEQAFRSGHSTNQGPNPSYLSFGGSYNPIFTASPGYWYQDKCLEQCPTGRIVTSRGCEVPQLPCEQDKTLVDNACVSLTFTEITGDICGTNTGPVKIKAGDHAVYCNTDFQGPVVIEPGTTLKASGTVSLKFSHSLIARGTAASPIKFEVLSNESLASYWSSIFINSTEVPGSYGPIPLPFQFKSGSDLSYVEISGTNPNSSDSDFTFQGHYDHVFFTSGVLKFTTNFCCNSMANWSRGAVVVENSRLNTQSLHVTGDSYSNTPQYAALWNTEVQINNYDWFNNDQRILSVGNQFSTNNGNPYIGAQGFFFLNEMTSSNNPLYPSFSNYSHPLYLMGNLVNDSNFPTPSVGFRKSDNSLTNVSDKVAVILSSSDGIDPPNAMMVKLNDTIRLNVLAFQKMANETPLKTEVITNLCGLTWSLKDVLHNNADVAIPPGLSGQKPTFQLSAAGSYKLQLTGLGIPDGNNCTSKEVMGATDLVITITDN